MQNLKTVFDNFSPLAKLEQMKKRIELKKRIDTHNENFNPEARAKFWDNFNKPLYLKIQSLKTN